MAFIFPISGRQNKRADWIGNANGVRTAPNDDHECQTPVLVFLYRAILLAVWKRFYFFSKFGFSGYSEFHREPLNTVLISRKSMWYHNGGNAERIPRVPKCFDVQWTYGLFCRHDLAKLFEPQCADTRACFSNKRSTNVYFNSRNAFEYRQKTTSESGRQWAFFVTRSLLRIRGNRRMIALRYLIDLFILNWKKHRIADIYDCLCFFQNCGHILHFYFFNGPPYTRSSRAS